MIHRPCLRMPAPGAVGGGFWRRLGHGRQTDPRPCPASTARHKYAVPGRGGVDTALSHMRALWGLDSPHPALRFPRAPPGRMNPLASQFAVPPQGRQPPAPVDMEEARRHYSQLASRLADPNSSQVPPPGHPMHDRADSVRALRAENDRLLKENADLRRTAEEKAAGRGPGPEDGRPF